MASPMISMRSQCAKWSKVQLPNESSASAPWTSVGLYQNMFEFSFFFFNSIFSSWFQDLNSKFLEVQIRYTTKNRVWPNYCTMGWAFAKNRKLILLNSLSVQFLDLENKPQTQTCSNTIHHYHEPFLWMTLSPGSGWQCRH